MFFSIYHLFMKNLLILTLLTLFTLPTSAQIPLPAYPPEVLRYGNPSEADALQPDNYLIQKQGYILSYNRSKAHANWVAWTATTEWNGTAERKDKFTPDNTLPNQWHKANEKEYDRTGFEQGHLCPSEDRTVTQTINNETFIMTNIVPQAPRHNKGTWKALEAYCQKEVKKGKRYAYIIAGTYGTGGVGKKGNANKIGKINVPESLWKIVLLIPVGTQSLEQARIIAIDIPNTQGVTKGWKTYRTTVRAIEAKTGYNFLSALPTNMQDALETKVDAQ